MINVLYLFRSQPGWSNSIFSRQYRRGKRMVNNLGTMSSTFLKKQMLYGRVQITKKAFFVFLILPVSAVCIF